MGDSPAPAVLLYATSCAAKKLYDEHSQLKSAARNYQDLVHSRLQAATVTGLDTLNTPRVWAKVGGKTSRTRQLAPVKMEPCHINRA